MSINIYSIPNFVVSVYTLALGILALIRKPLAANNQRFFLLTLCTFSWLFSYGIMLSTTDHSKAMVYAKIGHASATFLIPIVYYFLCSVLGPYKKRVDGLIAKVAWIYASMSTAALYIFPSYLPYLVKHKWGYYPIGGLMMFPYIVWTFFVGARGIFILISASRAAYKDLKVNDYQRLKYYSTSLCVFIPAAIDFLPKFGLNLYPFGYVFVAGFSTIVTYAMLKHQLLDIDIVIRRSFVYSLLIFVMTFIYLSVVLISEFIFRSYIGYKSISIAILASLVVAIAFNPLRSRIQNFLDRYFFKIDPEKILKENILLRDEVQKTDQMKAVATLAAGMAHEIKNPLTSIKTFAEYLPQRYDDPEFREKFTRIVVDEVDRVNNIVKQLLDFSKPKELELKKESITGILDDTLNLLNSNLLKNKIEVIKNYQDKPVILVDKNQLKQAFLNIFLNSIQSMTEGGTLTVSTSTFNRDFLISIEDTGPGIPKENLEHIFDPFYSTKEGGTGLGLSIVHGIVAKHGGKINVGSGSGCGTKINVTLKNQS